jgi:hypothetical protein
MRDDREDNNEEESSSNHTRAKRNLRKRNAAESATIKTTEPSSKRKSGKLHHFVCVGVRKKSLNDVLC